MLLQNHNACFDTRDSRVPARPRVLTTKHLGTSVLANPATRVFIGDGTADALDPYRRPRNE